MTSARTRTVLDNEKGEIAAWVLILLMTTALTIAVWGIASERLIEIVSAALSSVCGSLGC